MDGFYVFFPIPEGFLWGQKLDKKTLTKSRAVNGMLQNQNGITINTPDLNGMKVVIPSEYQLKPLHTISFRNFNLKSSNFKLQANGWKEKKVFTNQNYYITRINHYNI